MTDTPTPEQLPANVQPEAAGTIAFSFSQPNPVTWFGTATCPHGMTQNTTYLIGPGVPPLNHAFMVDNVYRQHELVLSNCDCNRTRPKLAASVTFQVPVMGVPAGQQRYIPQTSATLNTSSVWWGPGLTAAKTGAFTIQATIQLTKSIAQGGGGTGNLLVSAVPVASAKMVDQGGLATANINVTLNININQSIALGYENTTAAAQDVGTVSLTINELWVP
jgi:hypothetical protein